MLSFFFKKKSLLSLLISIQVIDGLPAEFVIGRGGNPPSKEMMESMPYTQSLLAGCKALGYHEKAAPPTVTMPRLKVRLCDTYIYIFVQVFHYASCALFPGDGIRGNWKLSRCSI